MARSSAGAPPRTLTGRLLLWHAVAVLGVLLAMGVVTDRVLEHYFIEQLSTSLASEARAVRQALPSSGDLQADVQRLGKAIGVRITIIRTDGVVLADSEHDPATMENHRTRPEVQEALRGEVGTSSRRSATIGISFRYVALPPSDGRIVRVALPLVEVYSRLRTVRLILGIGLAAAASAGLIALTLIARSLTRPLREITGAVQRVGEGDLSTEIPEGGSQEIALLAHTLNRMRQEVAARVRAADEERTARDAILSSLEEGVVLFGPDGLSLYQNDRAVALLGHRAEQVTRFGLPALRRLVATATEGGSPTTVEIHPAGKDRTLFASAVALPGDGRVLLVLRDVTQARRIEAVRRDFVANASHELKTPAASIRALAETMASTASDDPVAVRRFSEQLEQEVVRLSGIISDLLDLSRLEGGGEEWREVRLDHLVAQEAARLRPRALNLGLRLAVDGRQPVPVRGSERDLGLLVRNLLQNAIQYTRPGGAVDVQVSGNGEALLIVRDTGIGIPRRDRERIFERFYRVDRARSRETGGTGLGLSIVKHVAENHGGSVAVQSELGNGSTFVVRLPLAR